MELSVWMVTGTQRGHSNQGSRWEPRDPAEGGGRQERVPELSHFGADEKEPEGCSWSRKQHKWRHRGDRGVAEGVRDAPAEARGEVPGSWVRGHGSPECCDRAGAGPTHARDGSGVRAWTLGPDPGFESQFRSFPAVWPQVRYLVTLGPCFSIYKMGELIAAALRSDDERMEGVPGAVPGAVRARKAPAAAIYPPPGEAPAGPGPGEGQVQEISSQ